MAYRRKRTVRGMAEYPGYYCYDADRPSWLPYWLDSVTESLCKYNPKTIAGNIYTCAVGDPTCGDPTPEQQDPTKYGPGTAPAGTPNDRLNTPKCGQFESFNPATGKCEFQIASPSFLLLAGIGTIGLIAMASIFGGRR